jgi:hypothetical protein
VAIDTGKRPAKIKIENFGRFAKKLPVPRNDELVSCSFAVTRYSRAQCMGARRAAISGKPDFAHVSTSFAERINLNMRMGMRRFTRLTNAFSKKVENHEHALALYFMYYNFCRIHESLRVTPAMEAGITDHVWEISEIIFLLDNPIMKAA